ncbi:protein kinase family protein [Nocardiopsis alkaliphila]|uniref:protein kinase family protein n=1 Tax=Nocardiopsis alkaliphila TaxID=225762 RepID=UPI00034DCA50|nr:protein kinase family protein [Nocardiopsis alkaliphila]
MSTFLIEPGAKLANRYRLDHVVSETGGATRWKATDETLARPVAVWTFAEGFPRTSEVVRAARATSRVPDARVTQVFDADDSSPTPYVVEEWVVGSSLAELLREQGPMAPERAAGLVAEAAEAIAAAHAGGLHHLCLSPGKLMWSSGGAVKVTGIGVDAALLGSNVAQPAAVDAQGLGNLLYAALTGYWPTGPQSGLPGAPQGPMGPYPPGQLRQGISEQLATITARAALPQLAGQMVPGPPISSPSEFCAALAEVPRLIPLPVAPTEAAPLPEPGTSRRTGEFDTATGPRRSHRNGASSVRSSGARSGPSRTEQRDSRDRGMSAKRLLIGAGALLLFAGVVVGAWTLGNSLRSGAEEEIDPSADATEEVTDNVDLEVLDITGSDGFDPFGDHSEHGDKSGLAHDGDLETQWNTEGYNDPMGTEKSGVGLLLDLGSAKEIHELDLTTPGQDFGVQVRVGDDSSVTDEASLDGNLPVAWEGSVNGAQTLTLDEATSGRYVLIWFTELPTQEGRYRGSVNEVEVRGL